MRIHPTAEVSPEAEIGEGCLIWHQAQIREGAKLGPGCIVGKGVYIDFGVPIGRNVKIQNYALIFHGVSIEDGVFIGPQVCLTNDKSPRAVNPDLSLKGAADWEVAPSLIRTGAALGAGAVVLPGVTVGRWAMVGSGAVVTQDVPDYGLVWGNPARLQGYVDPLGRRFSPMKSENARLAHPDFEWEAIFDSLDWHLVY
ncbi:MAG TPA: acyltransferase [Anaerolineae bacterium]|nr:acyltransferase [Anaerolineae bacterium]HMR68249.1 acyltransferase [Anaerolineae bacterium]